MIADVFEALNDEVHVVLPREREVVEHLAAVKALLLIGHEEVEYALSNRAPLEVGDSLHSDRTAGNSVMPAIVKKLIQVGSRDSDLEFRSGAHKFPGVIPELVIRRLESSMNKTPHRFGESQLYRRRHRKGCAVLGNGYI